MGEKKSRVELAVSWKVGLKPLRVLASEQMIGFW